MENKMTSDFKKIYVLHKDIYGINMEEYDSIRSEWNEEVIEPIIDRVKNIIKDLRLLPMQIVTVIIMDREYNTTILKREGVKWIF